MSNHRDENIYPKYPPGLGFPKENESYHPTPGTGKDAVTSQHLHTPNQQKASVQNRQSIPEARELADLSILMEKALNSRPAAGQGNTYGGGRFMNR